MSEVDEPAARSSDHPAAHFECPGLDTAFEWDDPAALRGPILTPERLCEHAAALARAHGEASLAPPAGRLRARILEARRKIAAAYENLAEGARYRHDPTPAEEWLLDNAHIVTEQLREIDEDLPWGYLKKLPRLSAGKMRGYPRVYGLCLDYLRHTEARLDLEGLARYVNAYQSERPLGIGELWAIPIMLRLGLILVVGALATSETRVEDRIRAALWAKRLSEQRNDHLQFAAAFAELTRNEQDIDDGFLVQFTRELRDRDSFAGPVLDWIARQSERLGGTPEELARKHHLRRASDVVAVANSITSMRAIAALDWNHFFEATSFVEAVLRRDPARAYEATDESSRDRYRHAVEDIARRCPEDERAVAARAIELAAAALAGSPRYLREAHVGYYLVDEGREALERSVGYRPPLGERLVRSMRRRPERYYFLSIAVVTLLLLWGAGELARSAGAPSRLALSVFGLLSVVPASEVAINLVQTLVVGILPPRLLSKLAYEDGVPEEARTLVVVPTLLDGTDTVRALLAHLEVRSLANPDPNLHFALLSDFEDGDAAEQAGDAAIVHALREGVGELNLRAGRADRFFVLHRRRVRDAASGRDMGWERKRGKLEELNALLRGDGGTTFDVVTAPPELLGAIRYVITLDADTELPRDAARSLVGTIAHPLNQAELGPSGRVERGYGFVQPRVGTLPGSSRQSRFARLTAGPPGIDPYTTAVSDVYQDLFGRGSYIGKAIYDVDVLRAVLDGRVPENALLSHDLYEGELARTALATDIELFDDQPATYAAAAARQHRWIRGDWQLLPFLFSRVPARAGGERANDLSGLSWWKLFDNLRRSVLAPALVLLAACGFVFVPRAAPYVLAAFGVVFAAPLLVRFMMGLARRHDRRVPVLHALYGDLRTTTAQIAIRMVFLLDEAVVSADAVLRTLYRVYVSHRRLLEWQTAGQAARRFGDRRPARLFVCSGAAVLGLLFVAFFAPGALPFAAPVLLLWISAPRIAGRLGRPPAPEPRRALSAADEPVLRSTARKTWRFFETFVTAEDNHLPPDNYQQDPLGVVAHRTSPTNIGLYLLAVVSARDLGYLTLREAEERLSKTLATIDRLEKRNGHVLNWYDTTTLRPLDPPYVSMVDSGNLAAYLWTLRQACADLATAPLLHGAAWDACRDALRLARSAPGIDAVAARRVLNAEQRVERLRPPAGAGVVAAVDLAEAALDALAELTVPEATPATEELAYWTEAARRGLQAAVDEARTMAPFTASFRAVPAELSAEPFAGSWASVVTLLAGADSPSGIASAARAAIPLLDGLEAARGASTRASDEVARFVARARGQLSQALGACVALTRKMEAIGEHAEALASAMNFRFLYDEGRALFSIGWSAASSRLDASHYDLLASEARLGSMVAIAKGDVPQEHWFRLGRALTGVAAGRCLLSWSGSTFEYLMPLLVTRDGDGTLLHETYQTAVLCQRDHGAKKGVPWGISESAYNVMDLGLTYQYRAFGVPGLGLKTGLADDTVIAPYATALAAMVRPDLAAANLRALSREGAEGVYGYFEAIDYTPMRVPPGRRGVVVKTYMAHHQGMTLVSLANVLLGSRMAERFHRDPRIMATELLLEERVPLVGPLVELRPTVVPLPALSSSEADVVERVPLEPEGPLRAHLLGHGDISTLVTSLGSGVTTWKGMDVNRYREDVVDGGGIFVYVRDVARGTVWSAGHEPARREPEAYDASFAADRATLRRRDGDVETLLEIVVSPEKPADVRRLTLANHGGESVELEVTTYMEVVLAPRGADRAHRAFGNLFVETKGLEERGALLARRKARGADEKETWVVQVLTPEKGPFSKVEFETSRVRFLGRGQGLTRPAALKPGGSLGGTVGAVLDPVFVLRRRVIVEPDETVIVALTTAMATSHEEAVELAAVYAAPETIARTFELGWADAHVELRHLGIGSAQAHRFQRLLSAVLFPDPAFREAPAGVARVGRGKDSLYAHGISGDLPVLVLSIDDPDFADLGRELLLAQEFWRLNGAFVDLVFLNREPAGYLQPLQDEALDLARSSHARGRVDQRGGVFVRRLEHLSGGDAEVLLRTARVVLAASRGSLSRQLKRGREGRPPARALPLSGAKRGVPAPAPVVRPKLVFDNGIGGFDPKTGEYVLQIGPRTRTPAPWCNVVGYADFGFLISESGAGCTWRGNSQTGRLTPWNKDAVLDPPGEVLYLRDEATGAIWSATPEPTGGEAEYLVRHGFGWSAFEHERGGIRHELTVTADPEQPVKVYRLRLENRGTSAQSLTVFGFVDWVLGDHRDRTRPSIATEWDAPARAVLATNAFSTTPDRCAFFSSTHPVKSFTADRQEFFGLLGSRERPASLDRASLSGRTGSGLDPCGAIQVAVALSPNEAVEIAFALGEGDDVGHARALARSAGEEGAVDRAFERARQYFDRVVHAASVRTPSPSMDLMLGGWLLYQAFSCRILARSAFYQSSGAYGFRDQLQDVLALVQAAPELARAHLLLAASRQFEEGDVQHWWHPDTGEGVRTRYSDDLLWLPYVTAEYVRATGDQAICDERVPFLRDRPLAEEEHEHYGRPATSNAGASLYEHCTRALDRGTTRGAHGLPLMGGGDWNDGMNRVGEGGGESVWLAWFLGRTLEGFRALALSRGDARRAATCQAEHQRLAKAVEEHAWDGNWYRRAYFADGTPLGSAESAECKIDAIAQSWAVISKMGERSRAETALDSAEAELVREDAGILALLAPPFTQRGEHDPGYIAAYPPGIRENGGQYTHGVLWSVLARAELGQGERAEALFRLLNPIHHAETREAATRYVVEPYVVAADVYAHPDHAGRGGWTWYTGSAAWMYRIGLESILGVRLEGGKLVLAPCIPPSWQGYEVEYRHRSARYLVVVENPDRVSRGVARVDLDGKSLPDGRVPLEDDGRLHRVSVTLGEARHPTPSPEPDDRRSVSGRL